jgi:hypothetical protein
MRSMGWKVVTKEKSYIGERLDKVFMVLRDDHGTELQVRIWYRDEISWKIDIATSRRIYTFTKGEDEEMFAFVRDVLTDIVYPPVRQ